MSNIKKNFAYQLFYQTLISIIPFVTSPYISRVLGADGMGVYSYTFSVITYFKIFAALGIVQYGNRAIAKAKNDQNRLNRTFTSLFILSTMLSLIVTSAYGLYWAVFVHDNALIALIQGINLVAGIFDINWFFFGMEQFEITVTRNSILKILTMIAVFVFVKEKSDLWIYVCIVAVGNLVSTSAVWYFLPRFVKFTRVTKREIFAHLRPMLVLFTAVIAVSVFSYMDKIMIGRLSEYAELGYYENAWKMIEFPVGFITSLGTVMMPKLSNLVAKGDKKAVDHYIYQSMRFSMVSAFAVAFGIAGIGTEFAVVFWGKNFARSGLLMVIMSAAILLMSWNGVIRSQYIIPHERDKIYVAAVWAGAGVNFAANALLIPKHGAAGAAIGTVLAYLAVWFVQNVNVRDSLSLVRYFLESLPYAAIGLIMYAAIRAIGRVMGPTIPTLFAEVGAGALIYISLTLAYAKLFGDNFVLGKVRQTGQMIGKKLRLTA
uniref:flippase n=1 Tax=Eubacterium cellulosolvens TaxID=29322 RepID=UPI0004822412|nr:flippase [[Eubacterium] cellulosolvens]